MAQAAPPLELYITANWMVLKGSIGDKNSGPVQISDFTVQIYRVLKQYHVLCTNELLYLTNSSFCVLGLR